MTSSAASDTDSARNTTSGGLGPDLPQHLGAAAVGHVHVEQHHVRLVVADPGHRLADRAGLADHLDLVGDGVQLGPHPGAEQRVVVHQEHPDAHVLASVFLGISSCTSVPSPGAVRSRTSPPCLVILPRMRVREAMPVLRNRVRVEALAPVAHEHGHLVRLDLGVDADLGDPRVLGRVDDRLAGRLDQRGSARPPAGSRRRRPAGTAIAKSSSTSRARLRDRDARPAAAPRPPHGRRASRAARRSWPRARRLHLARRLGLLLDQRKRLQHGVVQVGGDLGAFLGADARPAFRVEVTHQPHPQRHGQHARHRSTWRARRARRSRGSGWSRCATRNAATPATTSAPPATVRTIPVFPCASAPSVQRRRCASSASRHTTAAPTSGHGDRAGDPAAHGPADQAGEDRDADAERGEADGLLPLLAVLVGLRFHQRRLRDEHPEQRVGDDPDPAQRGEHGEDRAHPEDRCAEMVGQSARDARDHPAGASTRASAQSVHSPSDRHTSRRSCSSGMTPVR